MEDLNIIFPVMDAISSIRDIPIINFGAPSRHMKGWGTSGNGSQPVSGGGMRERARRLARMQSANQSVAA